MQHLRNQGLLSPSSLSLFLIPKIHSINFTSCVQINDECIQTICKMCPNIQNLGIYLLYISLSYYCYLNIITIIWMHILLLLLFTYMYWSIIQMSYDNWSRNSNNWYNLPWGETSSHFQMLSSYWCCIYLHLYIFCIWQYLYIAKGLLI